MPEQPATFADPTVVRRARRLLSAADERMAHIIRNVGPFKPGIVANTFEALIGSIIHQQLSMKAARTIRGRVLQSCRGRRLRPRTLAELTDDQLRAAGLSRQKIGYVRSICRHFLDGSIQPARIRHLPDAAVTEQLVDIKGVGVWTAEMILMFNLQRCDVWPVDDLGLRHALRKWYRLPMTAKRPRLLRAGDRFRPYRSIATWYLWSSLDSGVVPGFQ